jgi:predicted enzyme related to lactoylglutathione lyase
MLQSQSFITKLNIRFQEDEPNLDKVVHFEIPSDNVERAKKFYQDTFGWKITPVPELKYTLLGTVEVDQNNMPKELGAINGGLMERSFGIKGPVITINVGNIEESIEKIKKQGGKIIQGKMEVSNIGLIAYFQDTEGNILGLIQPTQWRQPPK